MNTSHRSRALSLLEVMVILAVIGIFIFLAIPQVESPISGVAIQTVSNAKQIYLATFQMAADYEAEKNPQLGWPGDLQMAAVTPVKNLPDFVERLVELDYMKRSDVSKVFAASGVPKYNGLTPFASQYSPFKIYTVRDGDVPECIFIATKNFAFGKGLDPTKSPFGDKRYVIMRKGGDGLTCSAKQALIPELSGCMPGHTMADPGVEGGNFWE